MTNGHVLGVKLRSGHLGDSRRQLPGANSSEIGEYGEK